jgi:hypothetical protein
MNPLFLGLLAAGVALVAIVILYNWAQERRARRRIESAFRQPADVQLERERVEPQLRGQMAATSTAAIQTDDEPDDLPPMASEAIAEPLPDVLPATRAERPGTAPDADIECVVHLEPQQPVRGDSLADALAAEFAKPSRWLAGEAAICPGNGSKAREADRGRKSPPACCSLIARARCRGRTWNVFSTKWRAQDRRCRRRLPCPIRRRKRGAARNSIDSVPTSTFRSG